MRSRFSAKSTSQSSILGICKENALLFQMGAPAHLVVPDSSQKSALSSPGGSPTETESCATSSSLSFTDSFSSSFTQSSGPDVVLASAEDEKHLRQKKHVFEEKVGYGKHKDSAEKVKQIKISKGRLRESKSALMGSRESCTVGGATRKACCRCAGVFAADCAALCCCPCAIFSLVAFILIDLPSALARKLMNNLKKRLCIKEPPTACSSRNGDNSISIFTPTWSYKEPREGAQGEKHEAVSIVRFDTQNLLKHFEVEHFGFGCLSQKRE